MECTAMYDFGATAADELSFRKGQTLKVLNAGEDKNWCRAECDGRYGLIPKNYVQFKPNSWYHGKISRVKAEQMLSNPNFRDGAFLVRDSEGSPGDFSLSVKCSDGVQHYKILKDGSGKFFIWVVKFDSVNELIEYHRTQSISRTQTVMLVDMVQDVNFQVTAAYDFRRQEAGELEFRKGDVITVTECKDKNWWSGTLNNQAGVFPSNYVIVPPEIASKLSLS